jgi:pyridoxal 5'-phosphate synthase pdxT subunit
VTTGTSPARGATPPRHGDWVPGQRLAGERESFAGTDGPTVGVLALQGDVLEHLRALARVGARPVRVRTVADLDAIDGLVIPGGESTTIGKLLERFDLLEPIRQRILDGLPTFGTCAGMILLATELDQDATQPLLAVLPIRVRRNAFGRQVDSFDTRLIIAGLDGGPLDVSFIRAPWVDRVLAPDVETLAEVDGHPVVVRLGHVLAAAFHPELTGDDRLHAAFVATCTPDGPSGSAG